MGRNGHCDRFWGGFQSAVGMSSSRPLAPSCLQLRGHWFANDPLTEVGGEDTLSPSMGSSMARSGIPAAAEDNFALVTVIVVIRNLISFLNPNINSFVIKTLIYLVEMRLEWLDISWECTKTCECRKFFKSIYRPLNSSVFVLIINSPNQLGTFMTISHGKGAIYFSILCFFAFEFFVWQIVILHEWTNCITIQE